MAGNGLQVARFLITVDRYCQDELDTFAEMDIGHVEKSSNKDKPNTETQASPSTEANEISQQKKERSGSTLKTVTPRRSARKTTSGGKEEKQMPSKAKRARQR
jgi:hypothetical protein